MQAPGGPGAPPAWGPGRKQAFGTAPGLQSRVWMTIADGNLSDVFFPRLDRPVLTRARFLVAAPGAPPVDDGVEAGHTVSWLRPGVPAFSVCSSHDEYQLEKEFLVHPDLDAIVISGRFRPDLPDLRLYIQVEPHLHPRSEGNLAMVLESEPPVLVARQDEVWIAVVGPFARATAGFLNSSDLFVDLHDGDGVMSYDYLRAEGGNVALGAELGLLAGAFQFAIGFAHARADAEEIARQALHGGMGSARDGFDRAWRAQPELPLQLARVSADGGALARCSLAVLRCLEDKTERGAFVAAPCAPWGETQRDGDHIYHLVWPRDLYHIATALIEAGDREAGQRALRYLERIQQPDGGWPQNCHLDGKPHWPGAELDQVALPILLAWRLGMSGWLDHDPYPVMVRRAAIHLVCNGPATPLDRWEDAGGLSPSTLAATIAGLCAAAEFAEDSGAHAAAHHFRAVADYWADRLEAWCYSPAAHYYVRLAPSDGTGPTADSHIGLECLELVRRGVRAASDQSIVASLQRIDAFLKVETPAGPGWRRYWGDQYGEREDGSPWDGVEGHGRPWPLLTGERAHYLLAAGEAAAPLVAAMERFAGASLVLPEQVWDGEAMAARGLAPGAATGSAAPLGWAHGEYLKLLAAIAGATLPEQVEPARRRYVESRPADPAFVWSAAHPIDRFLAGRRVKLQLVRPALIRWTGDGWSTYREVQAEDTTLGLWVAELPTQIMRPGAEMEWTAHFEGGEWEGRNHRLTCVGEGDPR